jgi:hypothetical protein
MAEMLCIKLRKGQVLKPIIQFHPNQVEELKDLMPPPSEFRFGETDQSLLAGRTINISVWNPREDLNRPLESAPRPGSRWNALYFPFQIFGQKLIRFYSPAAAERIWAYCQQTAVKYGIDVDCKGSRGAHCHPIHVFVECCYPPTGKKPTPMILTIPENLSRQHYLVWIGQFMRDIYELLLNESFKPLGPECLDYTCGFLEENASGTGTFRAKVIVRPVAPHGRNFPNDFTVLEFVVLPGGRQMAVGSQATCRWFLNRHTNARPMLCDHISEITGVGWGTGSESDDTREDRAEAASGQLSESGLAKDLREGREAVASGPLSELGNLYAPIQVLRIIRVAPETQISRAWIRFELEVCPGTTARPTLRPTARAGRPRTSIQA